MSEITTNLTIICKIMYSKLPVQIRDKDTIINYEIEIIQHNHARNVCVMAVKPIVCAKIV